MIRGCGLFLYSYLYAIYIYTKDVNVSFYFLSYTQNLEACYILSTSLIISITTT